MTITFENDSDVIVYTLEKVIAFARRTQQIFVAQCIWWLASIIGLEQELIIHIDNLEQRLNTRQQEESPVRQEVPEPGQPIQQIYHDQVSQIAGGRLVSTVPRDLTEDQRLDRILDSAERVIQESFRDRETYQPGRVNLLLSTKAQLKKARKVKRLQEAGKKREAERTKMLQEIRAKVIQNLNRK